MLRTSTTTHDLGFLLHKHPERFVYSERFLLVEPEHPAFGPPTQLGDFQRA